MFNNFVKQLLIISVTLVTFSGSSWALDLDWSGQFRAETHWLYNYTLTPGAEFKNPSSNLTGYSVPNGGSSNAFFQTLFMRLRPIVVVNDNIYIKSEWHVEDPVYGFFGDANPYSFDQRQFYSTGSRGSLITAQRFWVELQSDIGTIQVGRAPLHWGLGLFWNSGDGIWDRYQSTGDVIRLISKFGSFTFTPSVVKYGMGSSLGGACVNGASVNGTIVAESPVCANASPGTGSMMDYSIAFLYDNIDEDLELGLNYIKRIVGGAQDISSGYLGVEGLPAGANLNHWDIFGRKKLGRFSIAGELPIVTGDLNGIDYRTWALALEGGWEPNDWLETHIRAGHVPGQPDYNGTGSPAVFKGYFFNHNYNVGMIMFNYQPRAFSGPNSKANIAATDANLQSPFDNPLTNANYFNLGGTVKVSKWAFRGNFVFAKADESAGTGDRFFNYWTRTFQGRNNGAGSQSRSLGWEMDFGTTFKWDDNFTFNFDLGWWFPGDFYRFNNTAINQSISELDAVFATRFQVGVNF